MRTWLSSDFLGYLTPCMLVTIIQVIEGEWRQLVCGFRHYYGLDRYSE
jgi:hypothetical protein